MDAEALRELFEPFGPVSVRRMFGGAGVYADGLCFAIELGGEVFVKVDAETEAVFRDVGSSPFVYYAKGKPMTMAYWRLVAAAYDDAEELKRFAARKGLTCNARMGSRDIKAHCAIDNASREMLEFAMADLNFSARAYDRILKVARTIADLAGSERITTDHVSEAVQFRSLDRQIWT